MRKAAYIAAGFIFPFAEVSPALGMPKPIEIEVTTAPGSTCSVRYGNEIVSAKKLSAKLKQERNKRRDVHIKAREHVPYRCIGGVIAMAQKAGFVRIGFVSEPETL